MFSFGTEPRKNERVVIVFFHEFERIYHVYWIRMETHLQQNSNLISSFKGSEYKVDCLSRSDPSHSQDYKGIIPDRYKLHSRKAPGNVGYI